MDMTGEYRIPAPRQKVWEALNDPQVLKVSIPGCEEIEKVSDTELNAKVRTKIGPVNARFGGKVTLSNINPPESYTISGEGTGGAAGFAKGGADVRLAEDGPDTTVLTYTAHANVGGKLAQLGSRLIQSSAKKMADDFFGNFSAYMTGTREVPGATAVEGEAAARPEPAAPLAPEARRAGPEPAAPPGAPEGVAREQPRPAVTLTPETAVVDRPEPTPAPPPEAVAAPPPPEPTPAPLPEAAAPPPPRPEPTPPPEVGPRPAAEPARPAAREPVADRPEQLTSSLSHPLLWVGVAVLILVLLFAIF